MRRSKKILVWYEYIVINKCIEWVLIIFLYKIVIEKYSSNARFCMICNYVSKIIPALQSRCTRFKFKHIPYEDAKKRIKEICASENLKF